MSRFRLLTLQNAKTVKGEALGFLTGILYLAPAETAGRGNVCPFASAGCRAACLFTAGRGRFWNVRAARIRKTREFFDSPAHFVDRLAEDVAALVRLAGRRGMRPTVRLNGTSDLPWERIKGTDGRTIFDRFPNVQFYDYTKRPNRRPIPGNYHLTFSLSESNLYAAQRELSAGRSVAVVFDVKRKGPLPATWHGIPVIDGDANDLRFLDPGPCVVGLRAKGRAKVDAVGFVQGTRPAPIVIPGRGLAFGLVSP